MSNTPKPEVRKFDPTNQEDIELVARIYNYVWCTRPTYFLDIAHEFEVTVDYVKEVCKHLADKVIITDRVVYRVPLRDLAK
jgi:hypothetical protein